MVNDLDFYKIREYEGSQQSGFEELICQIAHLNKPVYSKQFVRINGAGGDGGVECYWILDDDSEYCWQAKYFIHVFSSSQFNEIEKSFKTAIDKHPKMKRFYICLPIDKSDSRKNGNNGRPVLTQEQKWKTHVEKWNLYSKEKNRDVEIIFWGKHEISFFLTNGNLEYMGRVLYWFNLPSLDFSKLKIIAKNTRSSLGERYTPEFNVDLPILNKFIGLCLTLEWWKELEERKNIFSKVSNEIFLYLHKQISTLTDINILDIINSLDEDVKRLIQIINNELKYKSFGNIFLKVLPLIKLMDESYKKIYFNQFANEIKINNDVRSYLNKLKNLLDNFYDFIIEKEKLCNKKAVLLSGVAGIGKSHLLCDFSLKRLEDNYPTLFLQGAHYCGGNPIELISRNLDLSNFADSQVLSILDSMGESYNSRFLIVIDAINEGPNKEEWESNLNKFLCDLAAYEHIAIIISCRTVFLDYIISDESKKQLIQINHTGFDDYQHRAAEKYLSLQGIDKPSAPILAPEFSNPLFLKVCCKVLKQNNKHSFPKGLNGMTSIFDYYILNIEKVVAKKKKYDLRSHRVEKALKGFALQMLIEDRIEGIPEIEARNIIGEFDPNPNLKDVPSFFNILEDEDVLSSDVIYSENKSGELVYRFTYERFSDYFIALKIVEDIEFIDNIFIDNIYCKKFIEKKEYYSKPGIFEALEIIIAEKNKKELRDLLPLGSNISKWYLDKMFMNSILWRSPASFTLRTLELLNNLDHNYYDNPALDILLKLSTEPNHPWNADFLHKNLISKSLSDRDSFWSIFVALEDNSEEEVGEESIVRTIIEWSLVCNLSDIESERMRLCSIVLIWFLTTSNRSLRDKSTKSLVRILSYYPELINGLVCKFSEVDDTYLLERLYSAVYGVVCNINDKEIIKEIAITIHTLIFSNGYPIPHILIRDYARGILEYALHLGILPSTIDPKSFRPPYHSNFKIENNSIQEIERLEGDNISSAIKSSIMGFPGDFGNYTMSFIHNWSSSPISSDKILFGRDVKENFCNDFLAGEIKIEYKKSISSEIEGEKTYSVERIIEMIDNSEIVNNTKELESESLYDRIKSQLDDNQKEYFRWLSGLEDNSVAPFSRKLAQRWVCKRAFEFGWTKKKFASFEENCSYGRGSGSIDQSMERIGKKYQWMALYEFVAILSDNYHMINDGNASYDKYQGPWQVGLRNIDPTIWIRECKEFFTYNKNIPTWWQPYCFQFPKDDNYEEKQNFISDINSLPDFRNLLKVISPRDNSKWFALHGFFSERKYYDESDKCNPYLDCWFRINGIMIPEGKYDAFLSQCKKKSLQAPYIISTPSTNNEGFLGEYPWHPVYNNTSGIIDSEKDFFEYEFDIDYFIPYTKYTWEYGNYDYSINSSLNFFLPAKELINDMNLSRDLGHFSEWKKARETVFIDPGVDEEGPSYALYKCDEILEWTKKNKMEIVWIIGGEKQLYAPNDRNCYKQLVFNGLYRLINNKIEGELWLKK